MADNSSKAPAKNRGDVNDEVAALTGMGQSDVDRVIKAYEKTISDTLATGGDVRLTGFGVWKVSERSARTSRNPRTGEPVQVAARTSPKFQAGKSLKAMVESGGKGAGSAVTQEAKSSKAGGPGKNLKAASDAKKAPAKAEAKSAPAKAEAKADTKAKAPAKGKAKK